LAIFGDGFVSGYHAEDPQNFDADVASGVHEIDGAVVISCDS
jgi:hypothetical protein